MSTKSPTKALLAVFLTILMICSPVAAATGGGGTYLAPDGGGNTPVDDGAGNAPTEQPSDSSTASKISGAVNSKLDDASPGERVPVIIVFRMQPEDQLQMDQMSAAQARQDMQALANDTQGPTLDYLRTQQERGRVADIQPLYLRNAIAAEANGDVIREVAGSSVVEKVILDSKVSAVDDGTPQSGLDAFKEQLNDTGNTTVEPTGFERVVSGARARGVEEIGADSVQDSGITGQGVNVSVIDTGINDSHPALEGQVIKRKNFVDNATNVGDPNGHGTHVAGTIAGRQDAQTAVGVAPGVNLFDARALNESGSGRASDIIRAFEWSAENNADVASASLGLDPVTDSNETRIQIGNRTSANTSFEVYSSADGLSQNDSSLDQGFKPAYVYVTVENTEVLNTSADVDAAGATENLTVTLQNPNGTRSLERFNAGFFYADGTLPEGTLLYKFKPNSSQPVADGNWSVVVTNNNNNTGVGVDVTTTPVYPPDGTGEVAAAVNNLESTGTIPVVAAGNDGDIGNRTLGSPAVAENAITVGAHQEDTIDVARFSSRGPVGFGNDTRPGVDLIAPAVNIVSAGSPQAYPGDEPYVASSGTSMAAPHVSGTIALMLAANSSLDRTGVESTLESTAQPVPNRGENAVGGGALDAYTAVSSVTDEPLTNTSRENITELYAGIGNTSENDVFTEVNPDTDPVGDAGTAPDIESAFVRVDEFDAQFRLGLANSTSPNATFVTYIDADQNDSSGDIRNGGSEFRVTLTRTFDGTSYQGSVTVDKFNRTSVRYEPTDINSFTNDFAFEDRPQYVEWGVDTEEFGGINTTEFEYHIESRDPDSNSTDRFPDTGEADVRYNATIDAIGVAWNTSDSEPQIDTPLQFRLYNESGVVVGNRTVRTDATGLAETRFEISKIIDFGTEYVLEIEDSRGSQVRQEYSLGDANIDQGPRLGGGGGAQPGNASDIVVPKKGYETRPNNTLELNVPVYEFSNGTISPYNGPASIQIGDEFSNSQQTINNLTADEGVVTTAIVPADSPAFGETTTIQDFRVALTANYTQANSTFLAGDIDQEADIEYESRVTPETQVTASQTAATVTFQTIKERDDAGGQFTRSTPANITSAYEVRWITDRTVASFYSQLPDSIGAKLQAAQENEGQPAPLTNSERVIVEAAIQNISTDGTNVVTTTGEAAPQQRGIGQFQVTPPEDARIGFVTVEPNQTENETVFTRSDNATIYVDQRVDRFQRNQTAPELQTRYTLDIRANWDEVEQSNGVFVPNETINVRVELRDERANEPVPNTDVVLYTTGGDTTTVTTGANGVAETTVPAPNLDYQNQSFEFREQEVLAIAKGLQTADRKAVSDTERVFGSVFSSGGGSNDEDEDDETTSGVFADPSLAYNETNQSLNLRIDFRNSSTFEPANATTSLVQVGTPSAEFGVQRDIIVDYVGQNTSTATIRRNVSETAPTDRSRQYEVTTRSGSEFGRFDSAFLSGISTDISAPRQVASGETANATVTLTDRNNNAVTNATVVLYYTEINSQGTVTSAGNALVGTTNATGTATFTLSPDLADKFDRGRLRLRAGYATDAVADAEAGFGSIRVVSNVNITGSLVYENGTTVRDGQVAAQSRAPSGVIAGGTAQTNSTGAFSVTVPEGNAYDVAFSQENTPTDGVPDLHTFATTGVLSGDTSVGSNTLPSGNTVDIRVVDQSGAGVNDARVAVISHGFRPFDTQGVRIVDSTSANGDLDTEDGNVELAGNVTVIVAPPEEDTRFVRGLDRYTRELTVTNNDSVTVTLVEETNESEDTTPPTVRVNAPAEVASGQAFTIDASESFDAGGIANYTFTLPNGTSITQESAQREVTLTAIGTQNITVTVTDVAGNQNSATVSVDVVEGADLATDLVVAQEQRLEDNVTAEVTVTNVGSVPYDSSFDITVTATNGSLSEQRTFSIASLAENANVTREVNLTDFAQTNRLTGDLTISASAGAGTDKPEITTRNNNDTEQTRVVFSDLSTRLFAPEQVVEGANTSVFVIVRNVGTASADNESVTATVNGSPLAGGTQNIDVPSLAPGEATTTELQITAENATLTASVTGDQLFPSNNDSSTELTARPYELSISRTGSANAVEAGSTFYVFSRVTANIPSTVNVSLETPDSLSVVSDSSQDVFIRGSDRVSWEVRAGQDVAADTVTDLNVTATAFEKSANGSTETTIVAPKIRVTDQSATAVEGDNSTSITVDVRNETTYAHDLTLEVQAGTDGRTLKGLDYLVNYPYGCVEQTTSPMLTALNTDQYYRNTSVDYDENKVNGSIAQGVQRLAPADGANAQHDNGAWSMWGRDPSGDLFYTVYALYGTSEVANDPVQSQRTPVKDNLSEINQTAAVQWLDGKQSADGSFESNYYYEDRRSMTGLVLISTEQADQAGADTDEVNQIRGDAVNYLIDQQNDDGSWNGDSGKSAMATALAIRGLATATDESISNVNQTELEQAIADGTGYLAQTQKADGSWSPYHDSLAFNRQGTVSETTAHAVLAFDAANVSDGNTTVQKASSYLKTVYETDGSWGYTRATAIAIEALQSVSTQGGVSQTVTITVENDSSTVYNKTVTVDDGSTLKTLQLNDTALADLRAGDSGERTITISTEGSGLVVVSASNEQLINEQEFESNGGA